MPALLSFVNGHSAGYTAAFAWLALRIVYAWMYLYPAIGLIRDWPATVATTGLLFKFATPFFAFASLVLMIVGSLMILLGVYGQYAAACLFLFNLGGAVIHYRLAGQARVRHASRDASAEDRAAVVDLQQLAVVGHVTSAQKNFVLAAVALFITLMGTGPLSLVPK